MEFINSYDLTASSFPIAGSEQQTFDASLFNTTLLNAVGSDRLISSDQSIALLEQYLEDFSASSQSSSAELSPNPLEISLNSQIDRRYPLVQTDDALLFSNPTESALDNSSDRLSEQQMKSLTEVVKSEAVSLNGWEATSPKEINIAELDGVIDFDGSNGIAIAPSPDIDTLRQAERSVMVKFKAEDTSQRQVIYEEGGDLRGLNIYLDQGKLYVGGWNRPESESGWQGTFLATKGNAKILTDQWHEVVLTLNSQPDQQVQPNAFKAYLDGQLIGEGEGSQLWAHGGGGIGIGKVNRATRFHDGKSSANTDYGFKGSVEELQVLNRSLDSSEVADPDEAEISPVSPVVKTPEIESPSLPATDSDSLLKDSGFDQALDSGSWLVGKSGKVATYDKNVGSVAYIEEVPGQGKQLYLKLPEAAKDNYADQVSVAQDVSGLRTDKVYAVEASVKWLNPQNKLPSAIVSFWAKNPDASYRGKDFIITDGEGYKTIKFEFTPTQETGSTRFFLGLFTHIEGNVDDTEIYVDDYTVTEVADIPKGTDSRKGNLLSDGGFDDYTAQSNYSPAGNKGWRYTVESPVPGLKQSIQTDGSNEKLRFELPKASSANKDAFNKSVTGVYQNVDLVGGQRYKLSADFQRTALDQLGAKGNSLVQFIAYKKQESGDDLFLGPIDVELTNNNLLSKDSYLVAPESGEYTILTRLAGWANEGNGVAVEVDNVSLEAA